MFSRFPSFLFLSILTLLVAFQHVNSRANPADAASALALAACAIEAQPIALKLGEVRAVALSATQERTRWNSRPDVLTVQAGPHNMHLLKGEKPGQSLLRLGFDAAQHEQGGQCKAWQVEVQIDLSPAEALIAHWVLQETKRSPWSAPRPSLSAQGSIILLEGEVAQAEDRKLLEALLQEWLKSQALEGLRLMNWLQVRTPEQVMLEVRIAEVSSRLLDKLGIDWQLGKEQPISASFGQWSAQAGFSRGAAALVRLMRGASVLGVDAEAMRSQWRLLAQPNLMAQSGSEAQFLSGGKVYIPISIQQGQGDQLSMNTRLDEREYGVSLKFTPRLMSDGRIELRVAPEVSELSREGAVVSAGERTSVLPLVTVRKASTTVTLEDGESYVVGGLINFGDEQSRRGLPGLIDWPRLGGWLAGNDRHQHHSELV
ncbi:MAG: hypothetical protein EBZ84_10365, partial [Betaproteobacteria bacterium]|nr:hypothetical protein [Betaproteobacteria bacterium]